MKSIELKKLSNDELGERLKRLAHDERKNSVRMLHFLMEVEDRKLWAELGYPSFFEYCVQELRYSETCAYRRQCSMRLLREMPELAADLEAGDHNLTSLAQASSFLKRCSKIERRRFQTDEKRELLSQLKNQSQKKTAELLANRSPESVVPDLLRPLGKNRFALQTVVSSEFSRKFHRLRDFWGHSESATECMGRLIEKAIDFALSKVDPLIKEESRARKFRNRTEPNPPSTVLTPSSWQVVASKKDSSGPGSESAVKLRAPKFVRRSLATSVRREIWRRDQGRCTFLDPRTQRSCDSTFRLEIDHIVPVARGGGDEPENLRLTCQAHNQFYADQILGRKKMDGFRNRLPSMSDVQRRKDYREQKDFQQMDEKRSALASNQLTRRFGSDAVGLRNDDLLIQNSFRRQAEVGCGPLGKFFAENDPRD